MSESQFFFSVLLILFIGMGCGDNHEVIQEFPKSMQGFWKEEYEAIYWKINSTNIEITDRTTDETSIRIINPHEIRRTARGSCDDCTEWGIEIVILDDLKSWKNLYLDNFNELHENFDELLIIPSMVSPYTDKRTYFDGQTLNRIHNPEEYFSTEEEVKF